MGKLIIITAPSGSGKSTIVNHLLQTFPRLALSVSATTRARRTYETEGREYYFIRPSEFVQYIRQGRFVEWEEVYPGQFYGTLKSELRRLWSMRKGIVFDIDVRGAKDLKRMYPKNSLAIFIKPPSLGVLRQRLEARNTETPEKIAVRMARATMEMSFETQFDALLINDDLETAKYESELLIEKFIHGK